jgi:hypothetical protein
LLLVFARWLWPKVSGKVRSWLSLMCWTLHVVEVPALLSDRDAVPALVIRTCCQRVPVLHVSGHRVARAYLSLTGWCIEH